MSDEHNICGGKQIKSVTSDEVGIKDLSKCDGKRVKVSPLGDQKKSSVDLTQHLAALPGCQAYAFIF